MKMTQAKDNEWPPTLLGWWVLIELIEYPRVNIPKILGKIVSVGPEARYRLNAKGDNRCKVGDYVECGHDQGHHLHYNQKTFICIEDYKIIKQKEKIIEGDIIDKLRIDLNKPGSTGDTVWLCEDGRCGWVTPQELKLLELELLKKEIIMKKNSVKKTKIAKIKKPQPLFYIPVHQYRWLTNYIISSGHENVSDAIKEIIEKHMTQRSNNTHFSRKVNYENFGNHTDIKEFNTTVGYGKGEKEEDQPHIKLTLWKKFKGFFMK
jgi:hypothetical protein